MKKSLFQNVILAVTFLFITPSLVAQSPQGIPYQAVMRHADGTVMVSSAVSLTFMIHDGTANGTVVYQESHALTSNAQGLVSCVVGNGVVLQGNFSNINWGNGAKFLHVMMGTTDLGTQQMLSVPYALHSGSADNAVNATNAANATNAVSAQTAQTAANGFSSVSQSGDTLYMANGSFIIVPGISAANFPPAVLGCTDNAACNYNSAATQNDNSCLYLNATCNDNNANTMNDVINANCQCAGVLMVSGCTNPQACNYNSAANVDNGSCLIQGTACNDDNANTTNDVINGSCVCVGTAVDNGTFIPGNGVTDIDGNTYTSIIINGQEWMQQNLAVTKYRNGDLILGNLDNSTWWVVTQGAYSYFNDQLVNKNVYGNLYKWFAVNDSRGLCPIGWHVPSDIEWSGLINYLDPLADGGNNPNIAGGMMKSQNGWVSPSIDANNVSGFSGLPGGKRHNNGPYSTIGERGWWWTSSQYAPGNGNAWVRFLYNDGPGALRILDAKSVGYSVRCVRD